MKRAVSAGCVFLDVEGNRRLARKCNEFLARVRKEHPERFGFFVCLPDLTTDLQGALEEIKYGLDNLNGDGVALSTHYGGLYLGHPEYETPHQRIQ